MHRIVIPQHPDEITPDWLTQTLRRSGVLDSRVRVRDVSLDDPGRNASYAGYVSRISIEYDGDHARPPATMILKLPAPERMIQRLFRSIYRKEVLFYRYLAHQSTMPVPDCYAALTNRDSSRTLLLLEDLTRHATIGDHDDGCSFEQASHALSTLARFHAAWWMHPELEKYPWLGRYRVDSRQNWAIYAGAWLPFMIRLGRVTPDEALGLFRSLWRYRHRLIELEAGRPHSLQHGDFRLANLAFSPDDVYAFDWQVVRIGPPMFDVAWFILTAFQNHERHQFEAELLRSYHVALVGSGVVAYSFEEMIEDYRFALLLAIPQIMVIGGFLRMDPERKAMIVELLHRFEAMRQDHELNALLER